MNKKLGVNLLETLVAGAIFAGVVISGVTLSARVADNAVRGTSNRALSADAREALISIRDDIQLASTTGTIVPNSNPSTIRSDPNRASSVILALTPDPTPDDEITYYINDNILYRADTNGVRDLARNVQTFTTTVEERHYANPDDPPAKLVHVTLTLTHGDITREHTTTARLRGE